MREYPNDKLTKYINESELIVINNDLHIRLSKELLERYDLGLYNTRIVQILDQIRQVKELGIKYPGNANPIFYIYVVPDEYFRELLDFPIFRKYSGGGKPVCSYDLDGFNMAYGTSTNKLENKKELNISQTVNYIHEWAHLVHGMFFNNKGKIINEGFAESLPLYTMDYESAFDEHREMLGTLAENQILSAKKLINIERKNEFNVGAVMPNKSCGFDFSYISSYLFVRGCLEIIESKSKMNRIQATQTFLEMVKSSNSINEFLIYDIANNLGVSQEELLYGKEMQLNVIRNISEIKGKTI